MDIETYKDRPSVLDVFENFTGVRAAELQPSDLAALTDGQVDELIEHVDMFLDVAADQEEGGEAVVLDSMTSPILLPDDPSVPENTRRARQVALYHPRVIIPLQPLWLFRDRWGSRQLEALLEWSKAYEPIVRNNIFTLVRQKNPLELLSEEEALAIMEELAYFIAESRTSLRDQLVLDDVERGSDEELETIEDAVLSVLIDSTNAGALDSNLSFVEKDSGDLYTELITSARLEGQQEVSFSASRLLQDLSLPAIDDVPDDDFVAIRMQAEDFEKFREALRRVLQRTDVDVRDGAPIQRAFADHLDEVRMQAELLNWDIRDQALSSRLRKDVKSYSLSACASVAGGAVTAAMTGGASLLPILAGGGVSALLGPLLSLLLHSNDERKSRMLRFYSVLLDA